MPMVHEPLRYAHDEGHTDVCYSSDGTKFITCGADGDIRIWSTVESEDPIHNCIGEWALCVRQKNDNIFVATGSNDIQILTFPEGERNGVLDRFVAPINHVAISKSSDYIALAGEDMEIKLIQTKDKDNRESIIFDGLSGPCLSVALSPDSKILAASSGDGKLRIWNIENKLLLKELDCFPKVNSFANVKVLCRIDFEPNTGNILAYPDNNSIILLETSTWSQKSVLTSDVTDASFSIVQYSPCGKYIMATSNQGDFVVWNIPTETVCEFSKHSKSLAISGLMWNPLGNGQVVYTDIEGQLGIISGCIKQKTTDEDVIKIDDQGFVETDDADFEGDVQFGNDNDDDDDDENVVSVEKIKQQYMGDLESELAASPTPTLRPRSPEVPQQPAFMPSSTPEHLNPRYLCWNDVGIIRSYGLSDDGDDANKSIEVEFHDSTFHSSMMIHNYSDYTIGSISKGALVLANSNLVNVIPLNATSQEWNLKAEEYEEIILVASSEELICFATSNYVVRICSIFGIQRGIICIPGPLVCINAYKNFLLVAYHAAGVRMGDQCINTQLIRFNGLSIECKEINSALGPESTLLWLGFSDNGTPAMMDSLGLLSMYPASCNIWIPFCDTTKHRKSPADGFFVTTVFESYQAVGGIKCKGSIYPSFTPRPTMCELPLEPPFAESSTEKTQMEANLFTWSNLQVLDVGKKFKETGLKAFALACINNLDQRGLELIEILSDPQIATLAFKYASKSDKKRVADKLIELANNINRGLKDNSNSLHKIMEPLTPSVDNTVNMLGNKKLTLKNAPKYKLQGKELVSASVKTPEYSQVLTSSTTKADDNSINNISFDSQESTVSEEQVNPFLKSLKKPTNNLTPNPLSLTDKFAGLNYINTKENKNKADEINEKRKQPDSETEKPKHKQRKLDKFMFTKHS